MGMARDRVINFGYFVRFFREEMDLSRSGFIARAGIQLSEKRLWEIEMNMPEPKVFPQKFEGIARALGYDREGLDRAWRSTPVSPPEEEGKACCREETIWPLRPAAEGVLSPTEPQSRKIAEAITFLR